MTEYDHDEIAEMAREVWVTKIWPIVGDMGAMLFGLGGMDVLVTTLNGEHPADLAERMAAGADMAPKGFIEWLGFVGTGYIATAKTEEEAMALGCLAENPTPDTQHILMVSIATRDGHASLTGWPLELGPELEFGEKLAAGAKATRIEGRVPDALRALMTALA